MSKGMAIASITCLHANGGTLNFDFVKVTTESGLVGWSEYNEAFGGKGLTSVIKQIVPLLVGRDARATEAVVAYVQAIIVDDERAFLRRRAEPALHGNRS